MFFSSYTFGQTPKEQLYISSKIIILWFSILKLCKLLNINSKVHTKCIIMIPVCYINLTDLHALDWTSLIYKFSTSLCIINTEFLYYMIQGRKMLFRPLKNSSLFKKISPSWETQIWKLWNSVYRTNCDNCARNQR